MLIKLLGWKFQDERPLTMLTSMTCKFCTNWECRNPCTIYIIIVVALGNSFLVEVIYVVALAWQLAPWKLAPWQLGSEGT